MIIGTGMLEPQRYLKPRTRWRGALWAAAFTLLVVALALTFLAWENYTLAQSHEYSIARLRAASKPQPVVKPSRAELDAQKRWASLELERAFAWYPVFLALEAANSDGIELLEFSPDKQARRLVLRGEARDIASLFNYVQALSAQPPFRQVYLAQQRMKVTGALTTVAFEIRAQLM
jgi:hypothetical protein